jgi:membrane fusion protein (multidrug efflux system)
MKKRMILMLVAVGVFLLALGDIKYRQVQAAIAQYSSFQPPPEAVTTVIARRQEWPANYAAIGTVTAARGVTVSADLPGIVARIAFESGKTARQGEVLVELDVRQEQAQLEAAQAQQKLAGLNFDRAKGLLKDGVLARADYDRAAADLAQWEANVRALRATIERKTIRAPFSGVLGIRQASLGQYLAAGDPIVPRQSLDPIYVNFSVPQQEVGSVPVGAAVRVAAEGPAGAARAEFNGRITAVDSVVSNETRNVQLQATLPNRSGALRPGMFVSVDVVLGTSRTVVAVPASAIAYAPFGDSVFVLADMKSPKGMPYRGANQRFVKLGPARGDQVAVTSGLQPGDEVVTSGVFKLRPGAAVQVNNKVQPSNNPAPRPEDN